MTGWLSVTRGDGPLVLSIPHAGADLPDVLAGDFVSLDHARHDTDWHIDRLYGEVAPAGVTIVRTALSRSVIDVNRDPSGASLYPGQATTELCPTTTFDGEPLYRRDAAPDGDEVARRTEAFHSPYHAALSGEIARLRAQHPRIVVYDCHSIRSRVPRLFDGELPQFNIGTNGGASCDPALTAVVAQACAASGDSHVVDGRFRGGWITRHYGRPGDGVHAIQMELAIRGYADEDARWPPAWDPARAAPLQAMLADVLDRCMAFAEER